MFRYYREEKEGYKLPEHERAAGWRYDEARRLKFKETPDGRVMKTWELIKENSLHTCVLILPLLVLFSTHLARFSISTVPNCLGINRYSRGANTKYRAATRALEERIGMLQASQDDSDDDDGDDDDDDGSKSSSDTDELRAKVVKVAANNKGAFKAALLPGS